MLVSTCYVSAFNTNGLLKWTVAEKHSVYLGSVRASDSDIWQNKKGNEVRFIVSKTVMSEREKLNSGVQLQLGMDDCDFWVSWSTAKRLKKKNNRGHPVKLTLSVVMTVLFVHEEAGMG